VTAPLAPGGSPAGAIAKANRGVLAAFLGQDATAIAHYYAPQGRLLLPHVELIHGRPAIQAFWQGVLDMGIYCAERTTVDWQCAVTFGNEVGAYVLRRRDGGLVDQGRYVVLWQWRVDCWQIGYEVWRSGGLVAVGD
jgi:ketosteroid isomerase-like protein